MVNGTMTVHIAICRYYVNITGSGALVNGTVIVYILICDIILTLSEMVHWLIVL